MDEYTEEVWLEEVQTPEIVLKFPGGDFAFGTILPCPDCHTVGFYGARLERRQDGDRKYRACKFCGFWQEASGYLRNEPFPGAQPYRCIMVRCDSCRLYDWRFPEGFKPGTCPTCRVEMVRTPWPTEDHQHSFNKLREDIKRLLKRPPL